MENLLLIIDDDSVTRTLNTMLVKRFFSDVKTLSFEFGQDAIDYLSNSESIKPKLILLDLNMPEMNGWDFMNEIEKLNIDCDIAIVTSSNAAIDVEKSKHFKSIVHFFVKPLSVSKLQEIKFNS